MFWLTDVFIVFPCSCVRQLSAPHCRQPSQCRDRPCSVDATWRMHESWGVRLSRPCKWEFSSLKYGLIVIWHKSDSSIWPRPQYSHICLTRARAAVVNWEYSVCAAIREACINVLALEAAHLWCIFAPSTSADAWMGCICTQAQALRQR